jgi:transposase-like protein
VLRDVQQAFYGLCVNAGKQVLAAMMEADRVALCGAKNVPDGGRRAVRGGTTRSSVVLGGQRIAVTKPRARSLEQGELELPTFAWAANTDPLDMATLASLAAGVSTRRYAGTLDKLPEPDEPMSVSKSAVSRRWVALSQAQLHEWLSGSIKELDLPVVMIDGIHFRDRVILVALGIDSRGNKHVLGLREGSTEASRFVRSTHNQATRPARLGQLRASPSVSFGAVQRIAMEGWWKTMRCRCCSKLNAAQRRRLRYPAKSRNGEGSSS